MTAPYIEHITSAGERWDQLAARYYGDPLKYEPIVLANPSVPIVPVLDAGVRIVVPIIDSPDVLDVGLPPWKR